MITSWVGLEHKYEMNVLYQTILQFFLLPGPLVLGDVIGGGGHDRMRLSRHGMAWYGFGHSLAMKRMRWAFPDIGKREIWKGGRWPPEFEDGKGARVEKTLFQRTRSTPFLSPNLCGEDCGGLSFLFLYFYLF